MPYNYNYQYGADGGDMNRMSDMGMLKRYGTTDVNRIAMQEDQQRLWEQKNADAAEISKRLVLQQALDDQAAYQGQRMNRLGLSPLSSQLTDPNSAAYETVQEDGSPVPQYVDISMGDENGSAPPPTPLVRPRLGGLRRQVQPQWQEAQSNLGNTGTRTLTADEYAQRKGLDYGYRTSLEEQKAKARQEQEARNFQGKAVATAAQIKSKDPSADLPTVADDMLTSVSELYGQPAAPAFAPQKEMNPPPFSDESKLIESSKTGGSLYLRGGRYIRVKDGQESDVTDQLKAKGLI